MMMMSKDVSGMVTRLNASSSLSPRGRGINKSLSSPSHHHHDRIFDQHLECAEQLGAERAVDCAVIAGQSHAHQLRDFDLAVLDDRALLASADREDGGVWRVDHGGKILDAVHPEVGDGGGAALIFLGLEFACPWNIK